jgi:peptidoglycan/LPS O-acetylase OafA/YrhL
MTRASSDANAGRLGHLESIRGLASLQVLLLHVFSGLFPAIVFKGGGPAWGEAIRGSPLFYLYDGNSAVYIFFVLSGVVLTFAFQGQAQNPAATVIARIARLWIPAFAACLFAFLLKQIFGDAHIPAGEITGSEWLRSLWRPPSGLAYFLKDSLVNSVFLGYDVGYLFGGNLKPSFIDSSGAAYDAPLWTLSIELMGSLLVLSLVVAWRKSTQIWIYLLVALILICARTHYICFIVGHMIALHILRRGQAAQMPYLSAPVVVASLFLGVALCITEKYATIPPLRAICGVHFALGLPCQSFPQKVYGSILVFVGLAFSPHIRRWLSRPGFVQLGRLSFPVYLVHFPILMGLGSYLVLELSPRIGATASACVAGASVIAATLAVAIPFCRVDAFAMAVARRCRAAVVAISGRAPATVALPRATK